jgi:O-acetyl-ADP-ribose deacetylase (regulator of RNase III)
MKAKIKIQLQDIPDRSIAILQGDLLEETVDAIVNPTNSILFSYGLCTDIHQKAGQGLRLATKAIGSLKPNEAKITLGFRLLAAHIIHTCAPVCSTQKGNSLRRSSSTVLSQLLASRGRKPTQNHCFSLY